MAPTWVQRWNPNRTKTNTELDDKIDASWTSIFGWFDGFGDPAWIPNGRQLGPKNAKISKIEIRFFAKKLTDIWFNLN